MKLSFSPVLLRTLFASLLVVSMGTLAQGDTLYDDFESGSADVLSFGVGGGGAFTGIVTDCETIGNECYGHRESFHFLPTEPGAVLFGDIAPQVLPPIDMSSFIGYSIRARFIRTGFANPLFGQEDFTGVSPIEFGIQWDPNDPCAGSSDACSDVYDAPVELTETFQTFTVLFSNFVGANPTNNAQFKMLMRRGDSDTSATLPRMLDSADFEGDLDVDGFDFLSWQQNIGFQDPVSPGVNLVDPRRGNANLADGVTGENTIVNGVDLAIWETQYNTAAPTSRWSNGVGRLEIDDIILLSPPVVSAVPEPSSCCLILGCASMMLWGKRRQR